MGAPGSEKGELKNSGRAIRIERAIRKAGIMAQKRKQPSHFVQVARIRIETAILGIDVDESDDADVEREAIETANSIADVDWVMQPFDRASYQPHVQSIISQEEIDELEEIGSTKSVEALVDANDDIRYLLLQADTASGEANVVLQPWLVVDEPNLLTSDLCREWLASLEELGLTHMSERLDDLASGAPMQTSDQIMFGARRQRKPKT